MIFAELTVDSEGLDTFQAIVTDRRRTYVKELCLTVSTPDSSDDVHTYTDGEEELEAINYRYTNALCKLFSILKAWEDGSVRNSLRLEIAWGSNTLTGRPLAQDSIENLRFQSSITGLLKHRMLPRLSNVTYLGYDGGYERRCELKLPTTIAAALPNLIEIAWRVEDVTIEDTADRVRVRNSFAEAIKDVQLQPHATASLHSARFQFSNQRNNGENLIPSHIPYDPFSTSLRIFSQNLSSLRLTNHSLDSTIFWPSPHESNAVNPQWPFLKDLYINFSMLSPSGNWYFTGPDYDEDNDPFDDPDYYWEHYRIDPDPVTFTPFVNAFAKAVEKMPILEYFHLTSEIQAGQEEGKFSIEYHAPGRDAEPDDEDEDDVTVRRVTYTLTGAAEWKPSHEVRETLKSVGKVRFGGEVIETFRGGTN